VEDISLNKPGSDTSTSEVEITDSDSSIWEFILLRHVVVY
jgi:hypothetical protein